MEPFEGILKSELNLTRGKIDSLYVAIYDAKILELKDFGTLAAGNFPPTLDHADLALGTRLRKLVDKAIDKTHLPTNQSLPNSI